jgi:hypothetical protein
VFPDTFGESDDDDDEWLSPCDPRRQLTDSILHKGATRLKLEQGVLGARQGSLDKARYLSGQGNAVSFLVMDNAAAGEDTSGPSSSGAMSSQRNCEAGSRENGGMEHSGEATLGEQANPAMHDSSGGMKDCTTVMMRHVPFKYTQHKLMKEINAAGFVGKYDFFYLPMDKRIHANRGFVFLNFISTEDAQHFYFKFNNQYLRQFVSEKALTVLPADLQGFEENFLRHATTNAHLGKWSGSSNYTRPHRPVFFRALPPHVAEQLKDIDLNEVAEFATHPQHAGYAADSTPAEASSVSSGSAVARDDCGSDGTGMTPQVLEGFSKYPSLSPSFFCVYCGCKRTSDHLFCPFCGNKFR